LKRLSFGKDKKLLSNRQFEAVIKSGNRATDGLLVVYAAANDESIARLGVSISKSCGNAVVRNRLKRLIREAFRLHQEQIPSGFDYVVLVSPNWTKKIKDEKSSSEAAKKLKLDMITNSLLPLAERSSRRRN
jgi:ribonuclease P protein component